LEAAKAILNRRSISSSLVKNCSGFIGAVAIFFISFFFISSSIRLCFSNFKFFSSSLAFI
jgi:hypothetical protein